EMAGKKNGVKVRVSKNARLTRFLMGPAGKVVLVGFVLLITAGVLGFTYYYVKYSRLIDQKLKGGPFANTSKIFAAPRVIGVGDEISPADIILELRRSGYSESRGNPMGWFNTRPDAIEIFPGPESYFREEAGVVKFSGNRISQIISLQDNTDRSQFQLEPALITNLFDRNREKRRLVKYADIPKVLIDAVISAEDKRFFQHAGFDPFRIVKAVYDDLKQGRKAEGASTLSMQLARSFWLDNEKNWKRKAAEVMITLELEQKLSKEEIFEFYCNQIDLGRRGTFGIRGFGEAAQAYFGKDIRQLTIPEAAMLAGLVQRPSYYNPFRHPDRIRERRNVVLSLMRQNGYITEREYAVACDSPVQLVSTGSESAEAPYFVDLVNDDLQTHFQDKDFQATTYRIYTTLDLDLQRAAVEAVRLGMQNVDELLKKQRRHKNVQFPEAQVALIALDPHTGAIRALTGGRNYGVSQLNRVLAMRQPGSSFKPFVYAAAMDTAIDGGARILTPATMVLDEPTTFWYDNKPYEPGNFQNEYYGQVTLRQALAHSMNIATIKVAEMVGYDAVVQLAKKAGLNEDIAPTPAVALGSYDTMPLEIAGAYTVFANQGTYVKPNWISAVRAQNGSILYQNQTETRQVLDPRVAYLMVNMLEEVLRSGTAAAVRAHGFNVPAAGKTGTSRDGWFAGFTSELLCVVWVGFDDNRALNLQGAHSAAPIWAEFMKRALQYRAYRNAKPFEAPDGIVSVEIDPESGMPATPFCPKTKAEVFIAGTQPVGTCPLHGGGNPGATHVAGWELPAPPQLAQNGAPANATDPRLRQTPPAAAPPNVRPDSTREQDQKQQKRKGFFKRLMDVFK
ncbi:MAG TPA: PBP1A family penicillin-binding protein, partial [Bryobacteraceae bacterium]|nr:PBP1A family penicillin-binding protein [Bryobacteraceae bacterium]